MTILHAFDLEANMTNIQEDTIINGDKTETSNPISRSSIHISTRLPARENCVTYTPIQQSTDHAMIVRY